MSGREFLMGGLLMAVATTTWAGDEPARVDCGELHFIYTGARYLIMGRDGLTPEAPEFLRQDGSRLTLARMREGQAAEIVKDAQVEFVKLMPFDVSRTEAPSDGGAYVEREYAAKFRLRTATTDLSNDPFRSHAIREVTTSAICTSVEWESDRAK